MKICAGLFVTDEVSSHINANQMAHWKVYWTDAIVPTTLRTIAP
jgi:hypothetical protein